MAPADSFDGLVYVWGEAVVPAGLLEATVEADGRPVYRLPPVLPPGTYLVVPVPPEPGARVGAPARKLGELLADLAERHGLAGTRDPQAAWDWLLEALSGDGDEPKRDGPMPGQLTIGGS